MAASSWQRPKHIPYPTVWNTFTRTNKNGTLQHFEIQDITEDLYSTCIEHMTKYFLPDEPMYTSLGFLEDAVSIAEQQKWWRDILPEKMSLVCIQKDPNDTTKSKIVGFSLQYYHHKSHDDCESKLEGDKLRIVCDIVKYIENQTDRYGLLGIEEYMDEFGLSVHPDFRSMGIATELLKARCSLGKAIGLKQSITVFTAIASQKAAEKAGYANLVEINFSELARLFPPYKLNVKDTPTIRYMNLSFTNS